jgi:hypothetical protein
VRPGEVCFVNIGPRGVRTRRVLGVIGFALGALGVAGLVAFGAPREARALVFVPFWIGALGWFQAREKT